MEWSQATRYLTIRLSLIVPGDSTIIGHTQRNLRNGAALAIAGTSNSTGNFECWIELGSVSSSWQSQILITKTVVVTLLNRTSAAKVKGSSCDVSVDAIIQVISIVLRFGF